MAGRHATDRPEPALLRSRELGHWPNLGAGVQACRQVFGARLSFGAVNPHQPSPVGVASAWFPGCVPKSSLFRPDPLETNSIPASTNYKTKTKQRQHSRPGMRKIFRSIMSLSPCPPIQVVTANPTRRGIARAARADPPETGPHIGALPPSDWTPLKTCFVPQPTTT